MHTSSNFSIHCFEGPRLQGNTYILNTTSGPWTTFTTVATMKAWFKRPKRSPARTEPAVSAPASTSATTTSSGKAFPSGVKLLHNPEHSVVESVNPFQS